MALNISNTPKKPGVYIFKGPKERVLYVGKAKNLRNRLRSYFQESANLDQRKAAMVRQVKDFSFIVTGNELEALILEANLIKQYKPKFNIILRDDKNYPYIKITTAEEWPRIEVVRRIKNDGNLYFGPYVPSQAMWEALAFIRRNFLIRTCGYNLDKPMRPCVQYQMKRCPAPCAGLISRKEYMKIIAEVILFLKGEKRELIAKLEETMQRLSDEMKFEEAAKIRDRIFRLQQAFESQKIIAPELGDIDVIGFYREDNNIAFNILFVRSGVLIGAKDFFLDKIIASDESEIMHSFIEIFYAKEIIPPEIILVNAMPEDAKALKKWLKDRRGARIAIETPKDGKKFELLNMANENARLHFHQKNKTAKDDSLPLIKDKLHLKKIPKSIGAFDVSTIQGSESVGAFIYWEADGFNKDMYRHLKIKGVQGVDDYAMMHEIVGRVLSKEHLVPDLVVIDGGKGQLDVAKKVLDDLGIDTELISIAKKPDRAFLLTDAIIDLEDRSKESLLLKKIRDEVHRFAISFHRKLRDKRLMESPLEKIPGIGKKRRLELLRHFGSIENIRKATVDEIAKIKGFNKKVAEKIVEGVRKS
ncbi:MAG: excinuclease ABC subunit UvrC [Nitrospirae bacterium]|nr:excinuclease ABC subunit UvrC [Nitrospirota bacterium]MCL5977728.1 excinuclease ABC subunit UvrC [Nitrospirota bacterium]